MVERADSHRLRAILSADGVGYSRLMAEDQAGAIAAIASARRVFADAIAAEGGRTVDMAGDSVLALFDTAAGAVKAALASQAKLDARSVLRFRVGLHLGDVVEQGDGTAYGDGINVAARLQALAGPGAVVASDSIRSAVAQRLPLTFGDLGVQRLKNIARPVRAFSIAAAAEAPRQAIGAVAVAWLARRKTVGVVTVLGVLLVAVVVAVGIVLRDHSRGDEAQPFAVTREAAIGKSVAVLPFEGAGTDDGGFAVGVSDELATTLSRIAGLKVTARTSAHVFRGKQVPVPEIARQLGVRYLVTGNVRADGSKARIVVQLLSGADGAQLWSRSYERELRDIFAVQTEIARSVADNFQLKVSEADRAETGSSDLEARRLYLRAQQANGENNDSDAIALLQASLKLDPSFVRARLLLLRAQVANGVPRGARDAPRVVALVEEARQLAEAHPRMAEAVSTRAQVLLSTWRLDDAARVERQAAELDRGVADGGLLRAQRGALAGDMSVALVEMRQAVGNDPLSPRALTAAAFMSMQAERPAEALGYADAALGLLPSSRFTAALKCLALARLGRMVDARTAGASVARLVETYFGVAALRLLGDRSTLEDKLREVEATERHSFYHAYLLLHLGQGGRAIEELDVEQMTVGDFALRMQYDPAWDTVRATPAFRALLRKLQVEAFHDAAQAWRVSAKAGTNVALPPRR